MVGAGKAEGAIDAGNMLKPALARGELHCVGATTLDEYRKYIEKDAALERRFQKVLVDEPSVEATIAILRGLQESYEIHHGVEITDPAIVAAAELSHRYITDRFLPDKAIDLIDEAAARIKMEIDSKPEVMDRLDRRLIQLKIEREAVKKEKDEASQEAPGADRGRDRAARARVRRSRGGVEGREGAGRRARSTSRRRSTRSSCRWKRRKRKGDWQKMSRAAVRQAAAARGAAEEGGHASSRRAGEEAAAAAHAGRRRGDRRGRVARDRHPGVEDDAGRARQAAAHGRRAAPARGRPGRGGAPRRRTRSAARARACPIPNRPYGSFLFLGPDRRRQDRALQGARRVPVRLRGPPDPHRHVRVHGKALGRAPDRRAAGLRRLRGGRLPDRSGAPQAVLA